VRADKQITIEVAPNVLTIHLKRFQYGGFGSKINKHVEFSPELDLQHFMSHPECGPQVGGCGLLPCIPYACVFT
jgi:ubiquitin carboxyl-terminal hydrolase 36/42